MNGWIEKSVSEIAPLQRGFDLPTSKILSGDFPIVYSNGIGESHIEAMAKAPGVVTGRSGTIGSLTFIEKDYFPHNTTLWVTDFKGNDALFIYYLFHLVDWKRFASGSGVPTLNRNDVHESRLLIPLDNNEQRRIAEALSDTDALIAALEKLIAKKRAIKQGAMQELLTGKWRLPGFEGEWLEKKLGEVGTITSSGVDKKISENEIPVILLNYLDVYRYTYIRRDMLSHAVTAKHEKLLHCSIQKGDVFFTPTSETADDIAKTAVAIENMSDVVYSYHVVRLRPFDGYSGMFVKYACDTAAFIEQTTRLADGSGTRYVISLPKFREQLEIKLPPTPAEQTAIATILSDMDAEIDALTAKLNKVRHIKQGMMSELLTGRIRLTENDSVPNIDMYSQKHPFGYERFDKVMQKTDDLLVAEESEKYESS